MEPARAYTNGGSQSHRPIPPQSDATPPPSEQDPRAAVIQDVASSLAWHQRFSVRVALGAGASVGLGVLVAMIVSGMTMQRAMLNAERERVRSSAIALEQAQARQAQEQQA